MVNFRKISNSVVTNVLTLISVSLIAAGCQKSETTNNETSEGEIIISSIELDSQITTKSGGNTSTKSISLDDLSVRIENTVAEVLRTWDTPSDIPSTVNVVAGSYQLIAWSGDKDELPFFENESDEYYIGSEKFSIQSNEQRTVSLLVKNGATKVNIEFDSETFDKHYSSYSVDVKSVSDDIDNDNYLNYTPQTTQTGNFLPGSLRLRLNLTSKEDGQEYIFQPESISGLEAAQIRTINLKISSTTGLNSLVITTDEGFEYEETITLTLPNTVLPKDAPSINANFFTIGQTIESLEAVVPTTKYAATSSTPGGVKSYLIKALNDNAIAALGGASEIDIVGSSAEQQAILNEIGFEWNEKLNSAQTAAALYSSSQLSIYTALQGLKCKVGEESTLYEFELEITDCFNQKNSDNEEFKFTIEVVKPLFGWTTPTDGNLWSSHAEFDIYYTSNTSQVAQLWVNNGAGWELSDNQSFAQDVTQSTGTGVQTISKLTPNTQYSFKLMMGEHSTDEFSATTETQSQVENGDMESWQWSMLGTEITDIPYYQPYTANGTQYWATNNDRTTAYRHYNFIVGYTYRYNCFPAVSHTTASKSGTYAAEIRSTSASNIDALNFAGITYDHSQVPGKLFIGTFSYSDKTDYLTPGKAFASRPSSVSFYSTYSAYNDDNKDSYVVDVELYSGDEVIGTGQYISTAGESVSSYTKVEVPIVYTNRRARADKVYISFKSSTSSNPEVSYKGYTLSYGATDTYTFDSNLNNAFIGSVLRVDDITLEY